MPKRLEKIDFKKTRPELYRGGKAIVEVKAGKGVYLAIENVGEPGGPAFEESIGKLFALAYTAKFTLLKAGAIDFGIPPLECLWLSDPADTPRDQWRWRLMLRIPEAVGSADLKPSRQALREKKGLDTASVKRVTLTEGPALQVLHLGPYEKLCETYARLKSETDARGLVWSGPPHEVYLNDPRRAAPERIKTLVRIPVKKAPRTP